MKISLAWLVQYSSEVALRSNSLKIIVNLDHYHGGAFNPFLHT